MYCRLKSYLYCRNHETSCNHNILFSVSLSVSLCMFPCSKGHSIRAYLDTIKMTLDIFFPFNTSPILRSSWFPSRSDIPTFYTTQTIWKEEKFDPSELQFRGGATMHCILFFFLHWMNFKDFLKRPKTSEISKKKLLYLYEITCTILPTILIQ